MSMKLRALAGASILAAAAALASVAHAGTFYGGGSSLIAPYQRQIGDCYGTATPLYSRTGATSSPSTIPVAAFNYVSGSGGSQNCATTHTTTNVAEFIATGSGTGIAALYSHDASRYGDVDPNTAGVQNYPSVQYGLSETSLLAGDVTTYNSGGTIQSLVFSASPSAGQYPIPKPLYGPVVQFPVAIDPVAIAYDPVYKKVRLSDNTLVQYSLNVVGGRSNGGLKLDAATYCAILNGNITDWNDSRLTALNSGTSLKDPTDPAATFSLPLQIVGRSDNSGTTQVTTRHLQAACGALTGQPYTNQFTNVDGTSGLPATLQGATYDKSLANTAPAGETAGKFTLAAGSDGVAKYIAFTKTPATVVPNGVTPAVVVETITQGRIGYVGADYTLPASSANGLSFNLYNADVKNQAGNFREPSGPNAALAFNANSPPESNTNGTYNPAVTANGARNKPEDWVRVGNLANPPASVANAYPIVGTTNWIGYTCYTSANLPLISSNGATPGFLNFFFDAALVDDTAGNAGVLPKAGLRGLPAAWQTAIKETFLVPTTSGTNPTNALNLFIAAAGGSSTNSACTSVSPGA